MQQQPNDTTTMEQEPPLNFFTETKEQLKNYVSDRITLLKLQSVEKISTIAAAVASAVVLTVLGLFLLIFASITLGFFLSDVFNSNTAGFGAVAGLYLLLVILIVVFGKTLFGNLVTKKIIQNFFKNNNGKQ